MKPPGYGPQVKSSMFPFTRVPFWVHIFDPLPNGMHRFKGFPKKGTTPARDGSSWGHSISHSLQVLAGWSLGSPPGETEPSI